MHSSQHEHWTDISFLPLHFHSHFSLDSGYSTYVTFCEEYLCTPLLQHCPFYQQGLPVSTQSYNKNNHVFFLSLPLCVTYLSTTVECSDFEFFLRRWRRTMQIWMLHANLTPIYKRCFFRLFLFQTLFFWGTY